MAEDPKPGLESVTPRPPAPWLGLFCGFAILWTVANWPGLREAWWHYDDWALTVEASPFARSFQNGRPLEGLWLLMYGLEGTPLEPGWNVPTRAIQGVVHVAAAAIAARVLACRVGVWAAAVAVAPFLLWPFGAEATLWRATGCYPWAALCSVAAVAITDTRASRSRFTVAGALIAAAMLFQQSGACVGITLWVVVLVADTLGARSGRPLREAIAKGAPLVLGAVVGGIASIAVVEALGQGGAGRGGLAGDLLEKLDFLVELDRRFLLDSRNCPRSLRGLHLALLAASIVVLLWRRKRLGRRWPVALLGICACLVTPYLAVLVTAGSWGPWRIMYAAPLVFAAAFLTLERLTHTRAARVVVYAIPLAILTHYVPMAWRNSGEYPEVFRRDLELAERIEQFAAEHGAVGVVAPTKSEVSIAEWNPYGLRYMHGDSKIPALFRSWSARQYLRWLVRVPQVEDPELRARCIAFASEREPTGDFGIAMLPGTSVVCVFPP